MQKQDEIIEMFNQIAPSYDKANRILSFGIDVSWRKKACAQTLKFCEKSELKILDLACGTGDMIEIWQKSAQKFGKKCELKGIDPSHEMLKIAREKIQNQNVEFIQAKAQSLPLENESTEIISISYGIRNVMQRQEALSEIFRVLKHGGLFVVLEFTKRENGGLIAIFRDFYLKKILPILGGIISKNKAAYEYLPNSIDGFLSKDEFINELESAGFRLCVFKSFSFGISSMFIAQKIEKEIKFTEQI